MMHDGRPLIAHIIFRLDYGGMENGVVNLVNRLPLNQYRHVIIALSEAGEFKQRILRNDVDVYALHKRPGKDFIAYWRLYKLLKKLKPALTHTRNIGTWDCAIIAWLSGVPVRIHGEHGWDVHDPDGNSIKYVWIRKILNVFISRFITVSIDLKGYLVRVVGINPKKITYICNGVDTDRFKPRQIGQLSILPRDRFPLGCIVIGSVTRFTEIKDPLNLVQAFIKLRSELGKQEIDVRLLMIGDGPLRLTALNLLQEAGQAGAAWLPGSRDDLPLLMQEMDIFALGSLKEGISNTLLESMASGVPLVATMTGGNIEIIEHEMTGRLVPVGDSQALAAAVLYYVKNNEIRQRHGAAARDRAESYYSLERMLENYYNLYASFSRKES